MKKRTGIELKLYELTVKLVSDCGFELYDCEFIKSSSTLRVFIMDPATNSAVIEDCVKVDRSFTEPCEEESWIPNDFRLEVSSPGVYRSIKTRKHFESAVNEIIEITLNKELDKERALLVDSKLKKIKKVRGKLTSCSDEKIELDILGENISFTYNELKKASLDPDINR